MNGVKKRVAMRVFAALGAGALSIGVLAACGAQAAPSPSEDAVATDPEATLRIGQRIMTPGWDVVKHTPVTADGVLKFVYESLVEVDKDLNLVPGLATEWSTSDGGVTYDFTLLEGVKFSDGTDMDATDVKASIDYYRSEASLIKADLSRVQEVIVVDEQTVRIVQSEAFVGLPGVLSSRHGLVLSSEVLESGDFAVPVGTGKFTVVKEDPGVEITFTKSETHRDPEAVQFGGAVIRLIEDPVAMANALRSDEIDLAILDPSQVGGVEAAGFSTYDVKMSQLVTISLNPVLAPELASQEVRDALSMAIDREGIVAATLFGRGTPASQFAYEGTIGYNDSIERIPYDPEQAKKLLAKAGYPDGFEMTFVAQANNKALAEAVQANWAEIGVKLNLEFPAGLGVGQALFGNPTPTVPVGTSNVPNEADTTSYLSRFLAENARWNPGRFADPEVIELLNASGQTEGEERERVFDELQAVMRERTQATIPVAYRAQAVGYSDRVLGMQEFQGSFPIVDGLSIAAD